MSSMQEDIQCASSDTRPPMLDRTNFESWQQRIRLYCLGKDNGENIMKSINEGPFHMGTVSDVIVGGTEGAVQQRPSTLRESHNTTFHRKQGKQHEVACNETELLMEWMHLKPNNDPLALVSDASVQQYPTQSSMSPQSSKEPYPADNFQLDSGSSSIENLIEGKLIQSHLPSSTQS
ncbi:hypothetical protein Tco_0740444 [Tanacetum coccineum]